MYSYTPITSTWCVSTVRENLRFQLLARKPVGNYLALTKCQHYRLLCTRHSLTWQTNPQYRACQQDNVSFNMQHITGECFLLKESGNSNSVTARSTALIKSSNNLTVFTNSYMRLIHTLKSLHSVHAVLMCVSRKSNSTRGFVHSEFNGQSCNGKGVCSLSGRSRTCPRCII